MKNDVLMTLRELQTKLQKEGSITIRDRFRVDTL